MKVGDLVRIKPADSETPLVEEGWIGVVIDFKDRGQKGKWNRQRYAVVCWNEKYPQEEEHPCSIEVISAEG